MPDPVEVVGRLARLVSVAKVTKDGEVSVVLKLGFEIDQLDEDAVEQLTRLQHENELAITIDKRQLGLFDGGRVTVSTRPA